MYFLRKSSKGVVPFSKGRHLSFRRKCIGGENVWVAPWFSCNMPLNFVR